MKFVAAYRRGEKWVYNNNKWKRSKVGFFFHFIMFPVFLLWESMERQMIHKITFVKKNQECVK